MGHRGETAISVIIPTHNRREMLPRALRSVQGQSLRPGEIIVVDDGSTDGTADMLAREFPEVRCLSQPQRGVSAARNHGIAAAGGAWLALLDSDDAWQPEKLERQWTMITDAPDAVLCHTNETWIRDGREIQQLKKHRKCGGWIYQRCLPLCVISPSAAMIRRDVLMELGGFDETLPACEDYDLWLRLCARYPVLFVDQPLTIKYGGHEDQLSRRYPAMDRFRIHALEKILAADVLAPPDRLATLQMLRLKTEIYLQGARKRGKDAEVSRCEARLITVAQAIQELSPPPAE